MKKTLTLLSSVMMLMAATPAWAYKEYAQDSVIIKLKNGKRDFYTNIGSIDFKDDAFMLNTSYGGENYHYRWSDVDALDFANRFSNGDMLVSNAYYSLYAASLNAITSFVLSSTMASDEAFGAGGIGDLGPQALDFLCMDYPDMFASQWAARYDGIEEANIALQHLPLTSRYSQAYRDHLIGEAFFLRGYYYYELATMFGNNVPVYTDNTDAYRLLAIDHPDRVWSQIFSDLRRAILSMADRSVEQGRDDKFVRCSAAEGMMARAYLFYLGYYKGIHDVAAASDEDCRIELSDGEVVTRAEVIDYLKDCVEQGGNRLQADYRNLWAYTNRLTVEDYKYTTGQGLKWVDDDAVYTGQGDVMETLFKIKHVEGASWNYSDMGYCNSVALYTGVRVTNYDYNQECFPFGRGWGMATVNPGLWNDWDDNDLRKKATIADLGAELPFATDNHYYNDQIQETGYHAKKICSITAKYTTNDNYHVGLENGCDVFGPLMYWNYDAVGNAMQNGNLQPELLLRYADVLLMLSELTGDVSYMNQVRVRAGLEPVAQYSLKALQEERRHELAFEGVRWNDMRRWGAEYCIAALEAQIGQPIRNAGNPTANTQQCGGFRCRYTQTGGFWAIPQSAISASDYTLKQNPGWEVTGAYYRGWGMEPVEYEQPEPGAGTWTFAHNVNSCCWGTIKYRVGTVPVIKQDPEAAGVMQTYPAGQLASLIDDSRLTGEESPLAYMVMANGTLKKYSQTGELLGTYSYTYTPDPDSWRLGTMTIEQGGLLFPYSAQNLQSKPATFDVLAANPEYLLLVANDGTLREGDETTFWSFRHPNVMENEWNRLMRDNETQWTYRDYAPEPNQYGGSYTCGPVGCWGTLMPRVDGSSYPVFNYWSPVVQNSVMTADLAGHLATLGVAQPTGEEQANAYMIIDMKTMTISKYTADDNLINSGHFKVELDESANFMTGKFGRLVTDPGTILYPYQYGSMGYMPTEFEMHILQDMTYSWGLVYRPADDPEHPTFWSFGIRDEKAIFTGMATIMAKEWRWDETVCPAGHRVKFDFNNSGAMTVTSFEGEEVLGEGTYHVLHWNPEGNADGTLGTLRCAAGAITYDPDLYRPTEFKIMDLSSSHVVLSFMHEGQEIVWELLPPAKPQGAAALLVGMDGQKSWTFAYDDTMGVWGNAGNSGNGSGYDAYTVDGKWWSVMDPSDFNSQLVHAGSDYHAYDDIEPGAYMRFNEDGTMAAYTNTGRKNRSATFSVNAYDPSRPTNWEIGKLHTSEPAVLFPYSINEEGRTVTDFDIMYLDANHLTLVYTKGNSAGSWGEITFWRFQSASDKDVLNAQSERRWSWANDGFEVWGNAGNSGYGQGFTATNVDGKWWGITDAAYLADQLRDTDGKAHGDESNNAYMIFGDTEVRSYAPDGSLIRSGEYSLDIYPDGRANNWELGKLRTSEPALLFPWSINEGGYAVTEFDVMYLSGDNMTLVYTKGNGAGSWGEITYWRFKAQN